MTLPRPATAGDSVAPSIGTPLVLGESLALREALAAARRVAATDASVFITGESGTGKEVVAQYIHAVSVRCAAPFMPVNCAALPEGLFESELFGHRRGAFTGAVRDKPGILEAAEGGTVFLDELLEMPTPIQAKLLRVLEDGVVRRVGSERPDATVDVRLICATNRDPEHAVRVGTLREDLFFRMHVVPIHLPPLRERPEDIPILGKHFLATHWARHRGDAAPPKLSAEAQWALASHPWRGNVRELQNTIEHLVVVVDPGETVQAERIPFRREPAAAAAGANGNGNGNGHAAREIAEHGAYARGYQHARQRAIDAFEGEYLRWFTRRAGNNLARAARYAGIDRTTLYRLFKRQGLELPRRS